MAYRNTTLIARRGYSGLGATPTKISIAAIATTNAPLWTNAAGGGAAPFTLPKGTKVTLVEYDSTYNRVKIGGAVGKFYGYWVDRGAVTEAPSTGSGILSSLFDFAKGAGGSLLSSATTSVMNKNTPQQTAPGYPGASSSGISTTHVAIGAGALVLLLLATRKSS